MDDSMNSLSPLQNLPSPSFLEPLNSEISKLTILCDQSDKLSFKFRADDEIEGTFWIADELEEDFFLNQNTRPPVLRTPLNAEDIVGEPIEFNQHLSEETTQLESVLFLKKKRKQISISDNESNEGPKKKKAKDKQFTPFRIEEINDQDINI